MNDVTGGDRGRCAVLAGDHQPAGTVHIGRDAGQRAAVRSERHSVHRAKMTLPHAALSAVRDLKELHDAAAITGG